MAYEAYIAKYANLQIEFSIGSADWTQYGGKLSKHEGYEAASDSYVVDVWHGDMQMLNYNTCLDSVDHVLSAMLAVCTPTPEMDAWTTRGTSIDKLRVYLTKLSIRPEANVDPSTLLQVE